MMLCLYIRWMVWIGFMASSCLLSCEMTVNQINDSNLIRYSSLLHNKDDNISLVTNYRYARHPVHRSLPGEQDVEKNTDSELTSNRFYDPIISIQQQQHQRDASKDKNLVEIQQNIIKAYDIDHPSYINKTTILPHYHSKRCALQQLQFTVKSFLQEKYRSISPDHPVLVHSPCFGSDSVGNYLGDYFENIICSKVSKVNYISVAKIWEPKTKDSSSPFIDALPSIYSVRQENSYSEAKVAMSKYCLCPSSCHEKAIALWPRGIKLIRSVIENALHYHLASTNSKQTIVTKNDLSNQRVGTILPLIPEIAIHYRCGDNFIGYYGFLPFHIILSKIRVHFDAYHIHPKTIYILAENKSRKTSQHQHVVRICDAIFQKLYDFLLKAYPTTTILIQRGGDIYADMAKLTYAKLTICSISTFCLWPAISSNGTAYFPKTKLIIDGRTDLLSFGTNFQWITEPKTVFGAAVEYMKPTNVVAMLQ